MTTPMPKTEQAEAVVADMTSGAEAEKKKQDRLKALQEGGAVISESFEGSGGMQPSGEPGVGAQYAEQFAELRERRKKFANPGGIAGGIV